MTQISGWIHIGFVHILTAKAFCRDRRSLWKHAFTTTAELRAPAGWQVEDAGEATIPAHSEGKIRLTALAPQNSPLSWHVLGIAVHFEKHYLGEFTEAIIDYLL